MDSLDDSETSQLRMISSASSDYEVQQFMGFGSYGSVAQCRKVATDETVALKILHNSSSIQDGKKEEAVLKFLKELGSDRFNIVAWKDSFTFEGCYCLEFEKLDMTLFQYMEKRHHKRLTLMEIRPIIHQLARTLSFLRQAGILHADLKPENIMMVDHLKHPTKVKIIDFGIAIKNSQTHTGAILQTLWYRCPEILLGASFNEAIDVWSLGCIAVEMFTGSPLFPCNDENETIRRITSTIEKPPDWLLKAGVYTEIFFPQKNGGEEPDPCRFKSQTEVGGPISCLDDLNMKGWKVSGEDEDAYSCDRSVFIQLIKQMLKMDPANRIQPEQILQHPFITMSHLDKYNNSLYVKLCVEDMRFLQTDITCKGDEAQSSLTSLAEGSSPSCQSNECKTKKRQRGTDDDEETCERHLNCNSTKRRKRDPLVASTDHKRSPPMCQQQHHKRKDSSDRSSEGHSPSKKRRTVSLEKATIHHDNEKPCKLGHLRHAHEGPLKKRKRDDQETLPPQKIRINEDQQHSSLDIYKKSFL